MRDRDSYRFPFASHPAVRIMVLMVTGISMAQVLSLQINIVLDLFTTSAFGWILFEFILRKRLLITSSRGSTIFYFLLITVASMALMLFQQEERLDQIRESNEIQLYEWEDLTLKGEITESGKSSSGRDVYTMEVQQTLLPEGLEWKEDYKIRLYAGSGEKSLFDGDVAEIQTRIYEFPEQRNPQQFDYGQWLHSQGISVHGEIQNIRKVEEKGWLSFGNFREHILQNIDRLFDPEQASFAKAILLGYKDDLSPEAKQQFSRAGLSHIMAVSGLHVGFIVTPFWLLIPFLWGSNKGKWLGLIGLTIVLFLYAGITGFSPSVCRASLMAWLLTYGRLFHKVRNPINLTAVAAIILLLIDPSQLFDAGFQLSFAAVFIILFVMPEAQRFIPQKYQFRWIGKLLAIIIVSVVVQIGLFPILIQYFGEFSIVGPISNTLVIPLLQIVVPIGLGAVVLYSIIPPVIQIVAIPIDLLLKWVQGVASFTGSSNFSFISVSAIPVSVFLIWVFGIFMIASIRIPKIRWKMGICLLLAMNLFLIENVIEEFQPKKLEITFLDVGQGDAIHIKTPCDKHLLVDTGIWAPGRNSGEEVIVPYLKEKGIQKLDGILLSHPHADHIGGIVEIIEQIPVDTIYQTRADYESNLYQNYMKLAEEEGIPIKYPIAGDMLNIDPSIRLFFIGPNSDSKSSNINNHSLAFKLVYGKTSALFSGDAEKEQETRLATEYGKFLKSDLYKAGHHASNTSSTVPFIDFIEPDISVASLAFENRFRHPGTEAVSRLHQHSRFQNYTSLSGAIMYESDGNSFRKINWKE